MDEPIREGTLAERPGLEYWYRQRRTLTDFRRGPLGAHFDGFAALLSRKGYSRPHARCILSFCCLFNVFLIDRGITTLVEVSESLAQIFFDRYFATAPVRRDPHEQRVSAHGYLSALFSYLIETKALVPATPKPIIKPYSWILDPYLHYLRNDPEAATQTIQRAAAHVTAFLEALQDRAQRRRLHAVRAETVEAYLQQHYQAGARDVVSRSASLRKFFRYCALYRHTRIDFSGLIPPFRQYRHASLPKGAADSVVRRLLKSIDRDTPLGARDYALILLLIAYGIRGVSAGTLLLEDIDWPRACITFRARKAGKTVTMPLLKPVAAALVQWLRHRYANTTCREVFLGISAPHRPLPGIAISGVVRGYMTKLGFTPPGRGTRILRHSWAMRALAHDLSIKAIADALGHRSINTTFIYAKVDFKALRTVALPWPQKR
jgi:site-specific recombinase XerD